MNLADAVRQRRLVHWHDHGLVRTVEPYLLVQLRGQRIVLIAFQIACGRQTEGQNAWKTIDVSDGLIVDPRAAFHHDRIVPAHLLELVHLTYAAPISSPFGCEARK